MSSASRRIPGALLLLSLHNNIREPYIKRLLIKHNNKNRKDKIKTDNDDDVSRPPRAVAILDDRKSGLNHRLVLLLCCLYHKYIRRRATYPLSLSLYDDEALYTIIVWMFTAQDVVRWGRVMTFCDDDVDDVDDGRGHHTMGHSGVSRPVDRLNATRKEENFVVVINLLNPALYPWLTKKKKFRRHLKSTWITAPIYDVMCSYNNSTPKGCFYDLFWKKEEEEIKIFFFYDMSIFYLCIRLNK